MLALLHMWQRNDRSVSQSVAYSYIVCRYITQPVFNNAFTLKTALMLIYVPFVLCCTVFPQSACVGCTYRQGRAFSFALRVSLYELVRCCSTY